MESITKQTISALVRAEITYILKGVEVLAQLLHSMQELIK